MYPSTGWSLFLDLMSKIYSAHLSKFIIIKDILLSISLALNTHHKVPDTFWIRARSPHSLLYQAGSKTQSAGEEVPLQSQNPRDKMTLKGKCGIVPKDTQAARTAQPKPFRKEDSRTAPKMARTMG